MKTPRVESWVVYRVTVRGNPTGMNAVCDAAEWAAMDGARPGVHTLIAAGFASEGAAERAARGTSGDPVPRTGRSATPKPPAPQTPTP